MHGCGVLHDFTQDYGGPGEDSEDGERQSSAMTIHQEQAFNEAQAQLIRDSDKRFYPVMRWRELASQEAWDRNEARRKAGEVEKEELEI